MFLQIGGDDLKVETTDLYFSAYLMAKGITLSEMTTNHAKRQKIIFTFLGNGKLKSLNYAFKNGTATINVIDLKKSILHLKDIMYDQLKSYKEEKR